MTRVSELESSNLTLSQKLADLAQNMEDTNSAHRAQLAAKDNEIKRLLDELLSQGEQKTPEEQEEKENNTDENIEDRRASKEADDKNGLETEKEDEDTV